MNKNEKLLRIIGEIDDDLIVEADDLNKNIAIFPEEKIIKKNNNWKKIALTAACFVICAGVFWEVNGFFNMKSSESIMQNTNTTGIYSPSAAAPSVENFKEEILSEEMLDESVEVVEEEIDEIPAESPEFTIKNEPLEDIPSEKLEIEEEIVTGETPVENEQISETPKTDANPSTGGGGENPDKNNVTLGSKETHISPDEKTEEFLQTTRFSNLPLRIKDENSNSSKDFSISFVRDFSVYSGENGEKFVCIGKNKITNFSNSEKIVNINFAYAIKKDCDEKIMLFINNQEAEIQGKIVSDEEILDKIGQAYLDDDIEYVLYDFNITIGEEPVEISLAYLDE